MEDMKNRKREEVWELLKVLKPGWWVQCAGGKWFSFLHYEVCPIRGITLAVWVEDPVLGQVSFSPLLVTGVREDEVNGVVKMLDGGE